MATILRNTYSQTKFFQCLDPGMFFAILYLDFILPKNAKSKQVLLFSYYILIKAVNCRKSIFTKVDKIVDHMAVFDIAYQSAK